MEYIVYEPRVFNNILDEFKIDEVKNSFENTNLLVASNTNKLIASNIPDSILNVAIKELWKENGSITIKNGIQLQSSLNKKASVVHGCIMTFFLITSDFVFKIHIDTLI